MIDNDICMMALHDEDYFFSHVEQEKNIVTAFSIMLEAVRAAQRVQVIAQKNGDFPVLENASRIIQRLRDEMHYQKELMAHSVMKEGVLTIFGEECLIQLYRLHFKEVIKQRNKHGFDAQSSEGKCIAKKRKKMKKAAHIKALSDEDAFLMTLLQTPDIMEAMDLCRRAIHDIRRFRVEALAEEDHELYQEAKMVMLKVKDQLHKLSQINQYSSINQCIRMLFDDESKKVIYNWIDEQPDYQEAVRIHALACKRPQELVNQVLAK